MTFDERVPALAPWRLTPRQTRFVVTVALHGGYCLRRQYMAFAGLQYGKVVREFLDGLVARRLAGRVAYRQDRGFLYHVHARSIYRALQQDDNRNRRRTSPAAIARKLMILDFVIGEPATEWYRDRSRQGRVLHAALWRAAARPAAADYAAYDQRLTPTTRYFVHKLPIGVAGDPPRVHFVTLALDPSGQGFASFLHDHARLLSHLPDWTVVVVGPKGRSGATAAATCSTGTWRGSRASAAWDRREVARYFVTRRAVEANELAHVSVTDLNHCREARRRFADPIVETLYARWLVDGDRVLEDRDAGTRRARRRRGDFGPRAAVHVRAIRRRGGRVLMGHRVTTAVAPRLAQVSARIRRPSATSGAGSR